MAAAVCWLCGGLFASCSRVSILVGGGSDFFVLSRSLGVAFWWLGGLLVAAAVAVAVRKFFLSKKK